MSSILLIVNIQNSSDITVDRVLTLKKYLETLAKKLNTIRNKIISNNMLQKFPRHWFFTAVEYYTPVWLKSKHTPEIDI